MPGSFLMRSPMLRNCGGSASSNSHRARRAAIAVSILCAVCQAVGTPTVSMLHWLGD